ncbi:hypothetical protein B7P43_G15095 [Cryptotermes secundus]|uniref:Zinc finger CCHC domain-containing protein 7 n=1 Tax=Cryptotermes secundus TaxID=105785 RepID=A0A2J7QK77_9NEOP|nr:uncharacterized protein LOC111867004 [Cryptotermes secundus]XP_023712219.1 uncharacterized protein LOC111867004 [Cryptotermes secundus]XP_023712220.1 uncharacterized protein LOC111867004 [Cryptotermes secundus]XP_023712221.1 uncharacterized protein LOC111867004 [Cryptotermes secundus]PNF28978.1 hypothetical protein B7P43_G15095 [Cryptotermes secundus]PNF28979.1 hypothetical protein B7P43_G15095 [Cryptotermes secundus]PNF28980.1 hypothetical protein B7P43_G15095 [Cryptotermes secundus]PNF2
MESGSNTDEDNDYETHLYSLLHHSGENLTEEMDLLPGTPSSKRVYVEESNSSDVTPFYESKRSKAFRLNMVNSLIAVSDVPPHNVKMGASSNNVKDKGVIEPGQKQKIQTNYYNLLRAYKEATSNCMQSAAAEKLNLKNTNPEYRYRKKVQKEKVFSNVLNAEDLNFANTSNSVIRESSGQRRNTVTVSSSSCQDNVATGVADTYHTSVHRTTSTYVTACTNNGNHNSYTHIENKHSKSPKSNCEKVFGDDVGADRNKSKNADIRIEMRGEENRHEHLEGEYSLSKYNVCLNKDKENVKEESVIVVDSSDSESVVEVDPPLHEPPAVISLSSDEEMGKNMTAQEKLNSTSAENDIVVLFTGGKSSEDKVLPAVSVDNMHNESLESIRSCASTLVIGKSTTGKDSQGKRSKKKKQKRRVKSGKNQRKLLNLVYQSPGSWSKDMSHFYNDSWGGETFDVRQLQKSMPDNPSSWFVSYDDIVSRPRRKDSYSRKKCTNCNTWGHDTNSCPVPRKSVVCIFCGKMGHSKFRCPTPICLHCGNPSAAYKDGCSKCLFSKTSYQPCSVCKNVGHHPAECSEVWRRYHSLTTSEDLSAVPSRTLYKPQEEKFCSNCAARGHHFNECRSFAENSRTLSHNLLKRRSSSQKQHRIPSKRRKCERDSANMSLLNLFSRSYYYDSF